jgi:hypothetical protein
VLLGGSVLNITSITVAYRRDQGGAWVADDFGIVVNGDIVDGDYAGYTGPVFTANTALGHPPWVDAFIDAARPTLGTETP